MVEKKACRHLQVKITQIAYNLYGKGCRILVKKRKRGILFIGPKKSERLAGDKAKKLDGGNAEIKSRKVRRNQVKQLSRKVSKEGFLGLFLYSRFEKGLPKKSAQFPIIPELDCCRPLPG